MKANPKSLDEMLAKYEEAAARKREAEFDMRVAEEELAEALIHARQFHCLKVNWSRVRQMSRQGVEIDG